MPSACNAKPRSPSWLHESLAHPPLVRAKQKGLEPPPLDPTSRIW
jgi:hypothetical protein